MRNLELNKCQKIKIMSKMGKAAVYVTPAVISVAGVVVTVIITAYTTYKYFQIKRCSKETESRSSESFHTTRDYDSVSEYFDVQEEWPDDLEEYLLFERIDALMKGDENGIEEAYSAMKESLESMSKNPNFLWRFAKVHHLKGKINESEAEEWNGEGLKYANEAVAVDPKNPEAHKWFAILTGREAEFLKDQLKKVEKAQTFFDHIQKALRLRPEDWELHHLLGIFEYKLASLSSFEKFFARPFFKRISEFSYEVAKSYFQAAEKYNPNSSKETKLFLAKCYCKEKNFKKAFMYLDEALHIKVKSLDDMASHKEIEHELSEMRALGYKPFYDG